jgi:hypothetical protein
LDESLMKAPAKDVDISKPFTDWLIIIQKIF